MRRCTICGEWLVASTVNFVKAKRGKYGLASQCKKCRYKKNKQWQQNNKKKVAEHHKQYYEANRNKIIEQHKQYNEANKEKRAEQRKQYYETNKDKIVEYQKQYRQANKDKIAKQRKQYYETNKDKKAEYDKRYYEANKDKKLEYQKQYKKTSQGQVVKFNSHNKRRLKEEQQGIGITKDQWLEMMKFFNWRCAYSDEYIGGDSFNRTIDHIVPLNSNGDNMIWNCVPMTRSLNSSKQDKDMLEWYREQDCYSEARLAKIYEWQEYAYNKYGKDTLYFNSGDIQIKLL